MTDRPIIFSAPMIRALLDGRKTQTRRQLWRERPDPCDSRLKMWAVSSWRKTQPGHRLWVREAFAQVAPLDDEYRPSGEEETIYRADGYPYDRWVDRDTEEWRDEPKWTPSIFMPRWASRLTLTITDVRVQKAREISREDALAEGVHWWDAWGGGYSVNADGSFWHTTNPREAWWSFFASLHRPKTSTGDITDQFAGRAIWDPEVVALTFTVERRNIDAVGLSKP